MSGGVFLHLGMHCRGLNRRLIDSCGNESRRPLRAVMTRVTGDGLDVRRQILVVDVGGHTPHAVRDLVRWVILQTDEIGGVMTELAVHT